MIHARHSISRPVQLENLEPRRHFSADIQFFPLVSAGQQPRVTAGSDGNIWFDTTIDQTVGKITPNGKQTSFKLPGKYIPFQIIKGADNNLWIAHLDTIDRVTTDGKITRQPIGTRSTPDPIAGLGPRASTIVRGPDDAYWFSYDGDYALYRYDSAGKIKTFSIGSYHERGEITVGPDGAIWFPSEQGYGRMTTTGELTEVPLTTESFCAAVGPDNRVWITIPDQNKIASVTTTGLSQQISVPHPIFMVNGPDGNLWVTQSGNRIARVTLSGNVTEFNVGQGLIDPIISNLCVGPDGNVWFGMTYRKKVGDYQSGGIGKIIVDNTDPDGGGTGGRDTGGGGTGGGGTGVGGGGAGDAVGVVTGTIFNDKNGNKKKDRGEKGIIKVKVFLDENNNGKLDIGEQSVTTNSSGAYKFNNVPIARYRVYQVLPKNFKRTTKKAFFSIDLSTTKNIMGEIFGDKKIT